MKKILYILVFFLNFESLIAIESKIIYQIENEIITNIDIKNEYKYLLALNNELQNLDKDKIFNISKQSIIREKIKKIEILKNYKDIAVNEKYLDNAIRNIYLKINLKSKKEFKDYLKGFNVKLKDIENKVKIEGMWNQLVLTKYGTKIEINVEKIKQEIDNRKTLKTKDYLLSEIIFEIKNKTELKNKYIKIKKSIDEIGFKNTSSAYSISASAKIGGNLGWINEKSLNKKIGKILSSMIKGNISEPILVPGGVMILKINDIKENNKKINTELELKKMINYQKIKELDQYSKIYFNKVKKNIGFNE